jgi:hypothetical protein
MGRHETPTALDVKASASREKRDGEGAARRVGATETPRRLLTRSAWVVVVLLTAAIFVANVSP